MIYLHRSGPLLENGLDRPENCYGRYGFASFFASISISTVGVDGATASLSSFSSLARWVVVVDISQFPVKFVKIALSAVSRGTPLQVSAASETVFWTLHNGCFRCHQAIPT